MTILLDGSSLTLEQVEAVARRGEHVILAPAAKERVRASRAVVDGLLTAERPVYGVTTGFGKLSDVRIPPEQAEALQRNLLRSHAFGVGPPLAEDAVRASVLLRANVLAKGHSGVRPEVVELLLECLNRRVHPVIPEQGSVGASGDLAPLAHLALVLIGEGEAVVEGHRARGAAALERVGLASLTLQAKEGLALVNGTCVSAAIGALALRDAEVLLTAADIPGAMAVEALLCSIRAFDERIQALRPFPGQVRVAANLRRLLDESPIVESHRDCPKIQDNYSIRCIPQVHGASRDALGYVRQVLATEVNAATDNPLVFPETGEVLAGGNFHGQPIGLALDVLAMAIAELGAIAERRVDHLVNPLLSGLAPFLAPEPGLNSGYMLGQVTAAALASENKLLASPASVDSIPTSGSKEDHVSMSAFAARKAAAIVANTRHILAIEYLCAAQGLDLLRPLEPAAGTGRAHALLRERVPMLREDRFPGPDVEAAEELIRTGRLRAAVEEAVGPLS
ncbi:MAG: histidine ammonia-lyase [candidate division NC10 bacterium]|nr:histidine ammonia-lyase [candidate division NC10 bacterium]